MKQQTYIGELNDRISIYTNTVGTSATGAPTDVKSLLKRCWAKHTPRKSDEEEDGKIRYLYTDDWVVRYDKQLTKGRASDMFLVDDEGFEYNVIGVIEIEAKRYLKINTVRRG